ncbi:unnamed protein product [Urochloa humidicola]
MDMELLYQPLLLSILVIALIRILRTLFLTRLQKARLPPGPWKLPVIGSMHHLVNVLPHRALRDLAGVHGPLMMLQLGETSLVVASSREMARKVLKTHDANFATRPKLLGAEIVVYRWSDILFSPSGEYWRKLRHLRRRDPQRQARAHLRTHQRTRDGESGGEDTSGWANDASGPQCHVSQLDD